MADGNSLLLLSEQISVFLPPSQSISNYIRKRRGPQDGSGGRYGVRGQWHRRYSVCGGHRLPCAPSVCKSVFHEDAVAWVRAPPPRAAPQGPGGQEFSTGRGT